MTLLCDTGVVYAALVRGDRHHSRCADLMAFRDDVVIPAPVIVEVDGLGRSRGAPSAVETVLASIEDGSVEVVDLVPSDYARVRTLMDQYADFPLGMVDAAVVAVAERLREDVIATLDHRHFSVVKPLHCEAFTLVP